MQILNYTGYFFISVGAVFLFLGGLGILRMPDLYTRLQAGTKASTLGAMSTILGVGLLQPEWLLKIIIIIVFIAIANPLSSHALARGSHKARQLPYLKDEKIGDAYESETENSEKNKEEDK
ncbi:MAG: Na+/H+ antiporter subunit G [Chlorobi bacterium]|nr:Na+/H+ antiporter subunit G [Chlorobiota bacterium]